ncbi:hypothetical protein BDY24DRAFT_399173 [Mrakia frigida]|uniref:uncharacterized protein n=1 Tax=Mrakia frigida TaxID=29902 RepID=UPI003FCC208F
MDLPSSYQSLSTAPSLAQLEGLIRALPEEGQTTLLGRFASPLPLESPSSPSPTVVGHPNEPSPLLPLSISSGPPTLPHPPPSNATRWIHRFIRELFIRGIVSLALTFFLIGLTVVFIGYPVSPKFPLYNGFAVMVLTNVTSFFTITRKRSRSSKVGGRGGEGEKEGTLVQASAGEVQEAKVRIFEPDEKV